MSSKFLRSILVACAVSLSYAAEGCDVSLTEQYHDCVRIVDSQLHKVAQACARGDQAQAAQLLAEAQELLKSHHRAS